jgi:hypothetical protein
VTNRRLSRLCLTLGVAAAIAGGLLLRAVLEERFAFSNLSDVATIEEFDGGATGPRRGDLRFPTIDREFEQLVRQGIPVLGETDADTVPLIIDWVYRQLRTPRGSGTLVSSNDPLSTWVPTEILDDARRGGRFLCDTYARFAAATGQVLGLETRVVWLDGHVAAEFFDRSTARWIATDPITPGIVIDPDDGSTMSFADAAVRVRAGQSIDVRAVGRAWPEVDVPGSLEYLEKTLRRDLLVYVDGETSVRRITPKLLVDWIVGRVRGVRFVTERSTDRSAKRRALLAAAAVFVAALAVGGWVRLRARRPPHA